MFKMARKMARLSQPEAHFKTGIALKRLQRIEGERELPLPGEVKLLDQAYGCNRLLVLRYCGTCCPEGRYAGLQFENISIQSAGLQIISLLADAEKLLPELAEIICEGTIRPEVRSRYSEICGKLSQLRRCIMALEVQMVKEKLPKQREALQNIREFALKRKNACVGAQTLSI